MTCAEGVIIMANKDEKIIELQDKIIKLQEENDRLKETLRLQKSWISPFYYEYPWWINPITIERTPAHISYTYKTTNKIDD